MPATSAYIRYDDSVEVKQPDEEKTFDEIAQLMHRLSELLNDRYRHAVRPVHAKSHGLLKGTLSVMPNLPEPLRQGLFSQPASYPLIMRFSTVPGDILADSVSTPRGLAIKARHSGNGNAPRARWQFHAGFRLRQRQEFPRRRRS
jgi:catalase